MVYGAFSYTRGSGRLTMANEAPEPHNFESAAGLTRKSETLRFGTQILNMRNQGLNVWHVFEIKKKVLHFTDVHSLMF